MQFLLQQLRTLTGEEDTAETAPIYNDMAEALATCPRLEKVTLSIPSGQSTDHRSSSRSSGAGGSSSSGTFLPSTVMRLVSLSQSLTELTLWTNHWDAVAEGLVQRSRIHGGTGSPNQHSVLRKLHLTKCNVTADDTKALGRAFAAGAMLGMEHLTLSTLSWWEDSTVQPLVDAWIDPERQPRHQRLFHVVLQSRRCHPSSSFGERALCRLLCTALQHNYFLTVEMDDRRGPTRDCTERAALRIQSTLNRLGRGQLWRSYPSDATAWVRALQRTGSVASNECPLLWLNCTFELLRLNPSLFL
jgi:hypothetical protein